MSWLSLKSSQQKDPGSFPSLNMFPPRSVRTEIKVESRRLNLPFVLKQQLLALVTFIVI